MRNLDERFTWMFKGGLRKRRKEKQLVFWQDKKDDQKQKNILSPSLLNEPPGWAPLK